MMKKIMAILGIVLVSLTKKSFKMMSKIFLRATGRDYSVPEYQSSRLPLNVSIDPKKRGQLLSIKQMQTTDFKVASRIVSIRLDPDVAVINMRIYTDQKMIERDLLIKEPRLRSLMRGRRFSLPVVSNFTETKLDSIKQETVQLAEELINRVGNMHVKAYAPKAQPLKETTKPKAHSKTEKVSESPKQKAEEKATQAAEGPKPPEVPKSMPQYNKPTPAGKVYNPNVVDHIFEGMLVRAGVTTVSPAHRAPYETFQAVLLLDNGAELPLSGAELERELTSAQCKVGDRVAIRPMGKVPVTLANGTEGKKNLYQVNRLGAQKG